MEKAITLLEELLSDPKANQEALDNYVNDILKTRQDAKTNQNQIFSTLVNYGTYGQNSPSLDILSEAELKAITTDELIAIIKGLTKHNHRILYYGPSDIKFMKKTLEKLHDTPKKLLPVIPPKRYEPLAVEKNNVYVVNYDANQSYIYEVFKGVHFDSVLVPAVSMYNNYFGGGMNAIVFQEMREKRSLAYSANSTYREPSYPEGYYTNSAFIATQNDKIAEALNAFNELFEEMPLSEKAFSLAKESILSDINTKRITKMNVIWSFLNNEKMGYNYDRRMDIFKHIPSLQLTDVKDFNNKYIKGNSKTYLILGRESDMDEQTLSKFGEVKKLNLEQIFGY